MATRCESEYYITGDETVTAVRCNLDSGHEFDHLFMARWSDPAHTDGRTP